MVYDCIVIGAGMAGLTSALKLSADGKKVLVLERQPVPGGVATSFKRKGFTFESVLHIVDALGPGQDIREFLDKYGVSEKIEYIPLKEFGRVVYPEHDFIVKNDFSSLKSWLEHNFPSEKEGIDAFFGQLKSFYQQFDSFKNSKAPLWLKLLLSPVFYPAIIKSSCQTLEQFITKKLKDKKARAIIGTIWGFIGLPPSKISAFYFLIVLRGCWGEETAFIKGGFSKLFSAMVECIRERGSEVRFNTTVREIVTEDSGRIKGVRTDKGEFIEARAVISNANSIDTLTRMIDSSRLKEEYTGKLSPMQKSLSAVNIYLGLDVPAKEVGMNYSFMSFNAAYDHDREYQSSISGDYGSCNLAVVDHSQLYPGLAPPGKSTICIMTLASYADWQGLSGEEYLKKKKEVAGIIVKNLEKYLPGLSSHIEVAEVATPKTIERYGGLPEGAVYGFDVSVPQASINRFGQKTKIKGLFLAGAWTAPGCGVHGCFVSGDDAADMVLRYLGR